MQSRWVAQQRGRRPGEQSTAAGLRREAGANVWFQLWLLVWFRLVVNTRRHNES